MLSATFLFSGFGDYWGGNGDRWDDNKGCLFAYYDGSTTVRNLIDQWVDDFITGGDCDSLPECITDKMIRAALIAMLSDTGRKDYYSGALWDSGAEIEDDNDCGESPIAIVLIECDVCGYCKRCEDLVDDDCCKECFYGNFQEE